VQQHHLADGFRRHQADQAAGGIDDGNAAGGFFLQDAEGVFEIAAVADGRQRGRHRFGDAGVRAELF
jgi:hypothetical protein